VWLVIRGSSAAQDHWHTSYFRGARSPAVHMTTARIQTAATSKVSCKSRTLGPVYTGLYRHDEDLESTVRLDSIRAFFQKTTCSILLQVQWTITLLRERRTDRRRAETCSARHRTLNGPGQTASPISCRVATSRAGYPLFKRDSRERSTRPETIRRTRSRSPKNELSEMLPQPTQQFRPRSAAG
jgi:hypothetical protein